MEDTTEPQRRVEQAILNSDQSTREELATQYGRVYDIDELRAHFEVLGFLAPYVHVRRKADGVEGSLMFRHSPRRVIGTRIARRSWRPSHSKCSVSPSRH